MNKILSTLVLGCGMLSFSACATKPEGLSTMPVIVQGDLTKAPLAKHIMLIKAGTSIPVNVTVAGDVFREDINKTIFTTLKNDTYFYSALKDDTRFWISYDREHWVTIQDAFGGSIGFDYTITPKETAINLGFEANKKEQ